MNASIGIVGFIGWPVCALLMFLSMPNSPVSRFISDGTNREEGENAS